MYTKQCCFRPCWFVLFPCLAWQLAKLLKLKRPVLLIEFDRSFYPDLSCTSVFVHPQFVWLKHQRKVHGGKEDSYFLLKFSFNNCFLGACWSSYHITGTLAQLILRVPWLRIDSIWHVDVSLYHTLSTRQARWISRGNETAFCKLDSQCEVGWVNQRVGRFMWAKHLVSSRHLSSGNLWQATTRRLFSCHVLNGTYSLYNAGQLSQKKIQTVRHSHQYQSSSENRRSFANKTKESPRRKVVIRF